MCLIVVKLNVLNRHKIFVSLRPMRTASDIRQTFLDFFKEKGHLIYPSAPVVLKDDPTLMFTNSGMAQFKDCFLGTKTPPSPRVADTQKCLRVSGKHNDLEDVGHDTYHHTLFEMLGNWSFGDYYKAEAIEWSWELLTKRLGLAPDRLYVTVFGGDEADGVPADEEAEKEWAKWIAPDRILRFGRKANFWEMGDVGPCGPCSEIHFDLRSDEDRASLDGKELVNADHPQVVEIWNNVFMQYQRKADRSLEPLPATHVDTGMGFERLCMVMQNVKSTYDIDLFAPFKAFLEQKSGLKYDTANEKQQIAIRVIMDHIRAVTFAIADGQIPSNTGAGYVIRRVLRRASRYAYAYLGFNEPFLHQMVAIMVRTYSGVFDEVVQQQAFIERILLEEENSFLKKLVDGSKMFDEYLATHAGATQIDGDFAFKLYDTFGFPIDLTDLMARERGLRVDQDAFDKNLEAQKARSRAATELKTGDWFEVVPMQDLPKFVGYDTLVHESRILRYRTIESKGKTMYQVVLEETPFYAESGGQVGDTGLLVEHIAGGETIPVLDTRRENEMIVHFVERLPQRPDSPWRAEVNGARRGAIAKNHSATHLLHAALRNTLGKHVEQRGSLVNDEILRFDFSHFARMTEEELQQVENQVNEQIARGVALTEYRNMPIADAKQMGAMALFGEKYGDDVRVIVFDPANSVELCGGTHVRNTADIRLFKLTSESSSSAGIRRIEAVTSDGAVQWFANKAATLDRIADTLNNPQNVEKAVADMADRLKALEKEVERLRAGEVTRLRDELLGKAETINGVGVIRAQVSLATADDLKQLSFELKKATTNTLIVLGQETDGKALLSVILTDDLAEAKRFNAATLVRELAKNIQGGGGGQDFYATAGGKNPAGLGAAIAAVSAAI